jgi:hypothetical protein
MTTREAIQKILTDVGGSQEAIDAVIEDARQEFGEAILEGEIKDAEFQRLVRFAITEETFCAFDPTRAERKMKEADERLKKMMGDN